MLPWVLLLPVGAVGFHQAASRQMMSRYSSPTLGPRPFPSPSEPCSPGSLSLGCSGHTMTKERLPSIVPSNLPSTDLIEAPLLLESQFHNPRARPSCPAHPTVALGPEDFLPPPRCLVSSSVFLASERAPPVVHLSTCSYSQLCSSC